jgi:predicted small metal-binding protein
MLGLACKDAGYNCSFIAKGDSEKEVIDRLGEHGIKEHGLSKSDLTPEYRARIKSLIGQS